MADKNKNAAAAAMQNKGNAPTNEQQEAQTILNVMDASKNKTLSQDSKVMLAYLTQKRWVENPNLAPSFVEGAGVIADALMGDAIVTSLVAGDETFAMIIRKDENRYLAVASALNTMGITLPAFKELPAPTEEQLKKAGIRLLPSDTRVVTVDKKNVDKIAIDKKKAEKKIEDKNPTTDPTKIENEQQLKESLSAFLTSGKTASPDARIQNAIVFYHSYLELQAQKSENKDEELKKIAEMSRPVMLKQIADIVGDCPFAFMGIGAMLAKATLETKSPVAPFKLYKTSAKNLANDVVAEMVKTIVVWACESRKKNSSDYIKRAEITLKEKKNDEKLKANIEAAKMTIAEQEKVIEIITNPSLDVVDNLIESYNAEDHESEEYAIAHRLVRNVKDLYYKKIDEEKVNKDAFLKNCQQYAGIITNLFRDPLAQSINYSKSNLVELKEVITEEEQQEENQGDEKN